MWCHWVLMLSLLNAHICFVNCKFIKYGVAWGIKMYMVLLHNKFLLPKVLVIMDFATLSYGYILKLCWSFRQCTYRYMQLFCWVPDCISKGEVSSSSLEVSRPHSLSRSWFQTGDMVQQTPSQTIDTTLIDVMFFCEILYLTVNKCLLLGHALWTFHY